MYSIESLRCSSCGAPLRPGDELKMITCDYCGVAQQKIDAEKYVEQLKTDVFRWIQSMVPTGYQSVSQIDPVARAQLFEHTIRREVERKTNSLSMQLVTAGAAYLLVPIFLSAPVHFGTSRSIDPKEMLNEAARMQGLLPFAQSEAQTQLLKTVVSSAETLGYLSNVMRILSGVELISYLTIARNFKSASESLVNDKARSSGSLRLRGLASANEGMAAIIAKDLKEAQAKFAEANKDLQQSLKDVIMQPMIMTWYGGIKSDLIILESLELLIDGFRGSSACGIQFGESLKRFERYTKTFEAARKRSGIYLQTGGQIDLESYRELCKNFYEINLARTGTHPVPCLLGGGSFWIACWIVDVNYSFETGALFMKRGQMMQERLLIPCTFTLDTARLLKAPEEIVTDVFSLKAPSSFWERVSGKEKSLTQGINFAASSRIHSSAIPNGSIVVPSLSTRIEAERAANIYLEKVRRSLLGKLKIGIPSVVQVVYVSGNILNWRLQIPGLPQEVLPVVGEPQYLLQFGI